MHTWVLGGGFLLGLATLPALAQAPPAECATARPVKLTAAITPAIGQSPIWVTTGRGPIGWEAPDRPVRLLWVRDRAVRGRAIISGREIKTGAKLRLSKAGSTLGLRDEQHELDALGVKPASATLADLSTYSFHNTEAWFPEPGCYEITGRVGREQAVLRLPVGKAK